MTCPEQAIEHNDDNVVVDASKCNFCMDCIPVCPTGSIDEWRVVGSKDEAYSLEDQYSWEELPEQGEVVVSETSAKGGAQTDEIDPVAVLLAEAQKGAGGKAKAPATAAKPTINLYNLGTLLKVTKIVRTHATLFTFHRERDVMIPCTLAIARTGH